MIKEYRVQTYKDGNGKLYFTPQEKLFWFFWNSVKVYTYTEDFIPLEFTSYKEAQEWIDNKINTINSQSRVELRTKVPMFK